MKVIITGYEEDTWYQQKHVGEVIEVTEEPTKVFDKYKVYQLSHYDGHRLNGFLPAGIRHYHFKRVNIITLNDELFEL